MSDRREEYIEYAQECVGFVNGELKRADRDIAHCIDELVKALYSLRIANGGWVMSSQTPE